MKLVYDFFKKFLLYFHTIRFLKLQQIYYRLRNLVFKGKVVDNFSGNIPTRESSWQNIYLYEEKINTKFEASFLNVKKLLEFPNDWNDESRGKLWLYNLHYFEDLLSHNAIDKEKFHIKLFDLWIEHNDVGHGNGWEPYTISIRINNFLKAWLNGLNLDQKHFKSLHDQASYLSTCLEKHLLANHYFANLKALLFAGVIFDNQKWIRIAYEGLNKEIDEQILNDGTHFELSPMYHTIFLTDLLDIINLSKYKPKYFEENFIEKIKQNIKKMFSCLNSLVHADNGLSYFNDSVDGIAPSKFKLTEYAKKLSLEIDDLNQRNLLCLEDSGFIIAQTKSNKIIFNATNISPDYNPGHAHADSLSFEMSIGNERVFVNKGISRYGDSSKRIEERATRSHNTVCVDEVDSSQVWSGFRVAKRATIKKRDCKILQKGKIIMSAEHDGFKKIFNGPIHKRDLILTDYCLTIKDFLIGDFKTAKAYLYIHPDLEVDLNNNKLAITGKSFEMVSDLRNVDARIIESYWNKSFGLSCSNECLVMNIANKNNEIIFKWKTK